MNTSNKILTGFLLLVFLVPVFVLLSFKSKIRKGQFTVVKNEQYISENFRSGNFNAYKVVKLVGPSGRKLKCNLQYSDSLYYSYTMNDSRDSVRVYNLADTLFIQYINKTATKDNTDVYSHDELYVDVKLPSMEQLVINNAEVNISGVNTGGAAKNIMVEVYGTGFLSLGAINDGDNGTTNESTDFYTIDQLSLKSANGEMSLGKNVHISQLTINTEGRSTLNINEGASIDSVQGNLSDSSTVNASWKYVKKLAVINKN
jgi:hypothetical protein